MLFLKCKHCAKHHKHRRYGLNARCDHCGQMREVPPNPITMKLGFVEMICESCKKRRLHDFKDEVFSCSVCSKETVRT